MNQKNICDSLLWILTSISLVPKYCPVEEQKRMRKKGHRKNLNSFQLFAEMLNVLCNLAEVSGSFKGQMGDRVGT